MSNHDQEEGFPDSVIEMGRDYHEPPAVPRDQIWKAIRGELQVAGLLSDGTEQSSKRSVVADLARDLVRRRVPHLLAGYLAISWGFLEFTSYVVDNFLLSPHWNRLLLLVVFLLLPSVVLLAYNHGPRGKDRLNIFEKVGIPANLVVAAGILIAVFKGADLGAVVTSVRVEDEEGNVVERMAAKQEFRRSILMFLFDLDETLEDEESWLAFLVDDAIGIDLLPDDFVELLELGPEQLRRAGYPDLMNLPLSLKVQMAQDRRAGYLFGGTVARAEGGFRVTTRLHEAQTGRLVMERSYEGVDVLNLVDRITVELKDELAVPVRSDTEDLPVSEYFSTDPAAIEALARGNEAWLHGDQAAAIEHMSRATDADPTFAYAQYSLAILLLNNNRGPEALQPIQAALDNVHRIPKRYEFMLKSDYYRLNQDQERSQAVIEMWATLYPSDQLALQRFVGVQNARGDLAGMLVTLEKLYELRPDNGDVLQEMADVHERMGNAAAALAALQEYNERFPEDWRGLRFLAGYHTVRGELTPAREYLERALLLEPNRNSLILTMADLDLRVGAFDEAKVGYDRVRATARTSRERSGSLAALSRYHEYRGEMGAAVEALEAAMAEGAPDAPRIAVLERYGINVPIYFDAGRDDEAIAFVDSLRAELQPNSVGDLRLAELEVALRSGDPGEAQAALERAEAAQAAISVRSFGTGGRAELARKKGRVAELREDWDGALDAHRSRLIFRPRDYLIHIDVGRVLRQVGQLFEAEAEIREALAPYPSSPRAHVELAKILIARGDSAGAVEHLEDAMSAWANADPVYKPAQEARAMLEELSR